MRKREEIEKESELVCSSRSERLIILESLLDIRELLEDIKEGRRE